MVWSFESEDHHEVDDEKQDDLAREAYEKALAVKPDEKIQQKLDALATQSSR